jgi:hypothetical protein
MSEKATIFFSTFYLNNIFVDVRRDDKCVCLFVGKLDGDMEGLLLGELEGDMEGFWDCESNSVMEGFWVG